MQANYVIRPMRREELDIAVDWAALEGWNPGLGDAEAFYFLRRWLALPESVALGYRRGSDLADYGVIRRCRSGFKLGPLFAAGDEVAQDLFTALASRVPAGEPLFLDVPEVNAGAVDLARGHGMEPVFETARMYTSAPPAIPVANVYGVTSLELG